LSGTSSRGRFAPGRGSLIDGHPLDPLEHGCAVDEAVSDDLPDELVVSLAARDGLGDHQVVHLEAPSGGPTRVRVAHGDEPLAPARYLHGGGLVDTVGEVAVGRMERRPLADTAIDQVHPLRAVLGKDLGLDRCTQRGRRVGELPENRLVANHDDLLVVRDVGRRADHMLRFGARHRWPVTCSRTSRHSRHRSRGGSTPAKGVDCLSSRACSRGSTRKAAISTSGRARTSFHARA